MNTQTPEPFDTDLQDLFAGVHPAAGFEDRLVHAVRQHRRMAIPAPLRRAAIAATAVLVVGAAGYFGNQSITGNLRFSQMTNDQASASSNLHQAGLSIQPYQDPFDKWDFGGGSNSKQNGKDRPEEKQPDSSMPVPEEELGMKSKENTAYPDRLDTQFTDAITAKKEKKQQQQAPVARPVADAPMPTPPSAFKPTQVGTLVNADDSRTLDWKTLPANLPAHGRIDVSGKMLGDTGLTAPQLQRSNFFASNPTDTAQPPPAAPERQVQANGQVPPPNPVSVPSTAPVDDRKIIRTGTMEFDVDRFDTAQMQITKIVGELGGFVGATDSQKLPNGKVRGCISVRVPPEKLDTLVLSLRALGDLKNQQITASDITREYTDLQSELTADRAMQDRLLALINGGKGAIKDLLAAENELGTWRAKIEKAEGQIRYYNAQVAMSTLVITLSERDIQTPATATETETADIGIEAEDVEKSRNAALKAIDDVKGRIVEAELKRYDAGQLAARLVAEVPPDFAGAVIDQLKLLGRVARLEIHRQETTGDDGHAVTDNTPLRTQRKPTKLLISIYNLANVAPRRTTSINLAASDVEAAYTALLTLAKDNGGRVVTSNLDRGDAVKATGTVALEIPPAQLPAAMTTIRAQGELLKLSVVENPDTQNSTDAKQGLTISLVSLASTPARESVQQSIAAVNVPTAYQSILTAAAAAHARVLSAQLNQQDLQNVSADVQLDVPRADLATLDKAIASSGDTISRAASRSNDSDGTVDSKLRMQLSIMSADHMAVRETTRLQSEVVDVDKSAGDAAAIAIALGGRVIDSRISRDHGKGVARVTMDVPLDKSSEALRQIRAMGTIRDIDASRDAQAPSGPLAHAQIFAEFVTTDALVDDQSGPWARIRQGLGTSVNGLLWSLQWVVVGLCLIGPWAIIGWGMARFLRRRAAVK